MPTRKTGTLKGAYKLPKSKGWMSTIMINGQQRYLGVFDTEEEAHEAWAAADMARPPADTTRKRNRRPVGYADRLRQKARETGIWVPLTVRGEYAVVTLRGGLHAVVDLEDWPTVAGWPWSPTKEDCGGGPYARRRQINHRELRMHVAITGRTGADHRDGNGLNNRRSNLRIATSQQNTWNRGRIRDAQGYRGVEATRHGFSARVTQDGKRVLIGSYDTAEQAARAYDAFCREHRGEFAALNFPGPNERGIA